MDEFGVGNGLDDDDDDDGFELVVIDCTNAQARSVSRWTCCNTTRRDRLTSAFCPMTEATRVTRLQLSLYIVC